MFMNVFNCHINRAPVAGRVRRIAYKPGRFLNAELDKASEDNERNGLVIDSAHGQLGVVQIAGLVARRIVCFTREGQPLAAGGDLVVDLVRLSELEEVDEAPAVALEGELELGGCLGVADDLVGDREQLADLVLAALGPMVRVERERERQRGT